MIADADLDALVAKATADLCSYEQLVVWKRHGQWRLVLRLHDLRGTEYTNLATITEEQARRLNGEQRVGDLYGQLGKEPNAVSAKREAVRAALERRLREGPLIRRSDPLFVQLVTDEVMAALDAASVADAAAETSAADAAAETCRSSDKTARTIIRRRRELLREALPWIEGSRGDVEREDIARSIRAELGEKRVRDFEASHIIRCQQCGTAIAHVDAAQVARANECAAALAGIADPAAFVERTKAREVLAKQRIAGDPLVWLSPDEIAALAARWTDGEET